jgi:hypothetical protein
MHVVHKKTKALHTNLLISIFQISFSRNNSIGTATGYGLDNRVIGLGCRRALGILLFDTVSRPAVGRPAPIQWVPGALSVGLKLPGHEVDDIPPSSAEIKECVELHLHSPIRLHDVVLS